MLHMRLGIFNSFVYRLVIWSL
uniref:Uncharacterized protein n=1 Tax=Arundo donax TaxID=35708 RepID=A0A0A8Z4F5_ARUDO